MSKANVKMKSPDPVDLLIGSKVREKRLIMGLSQDALAKCIGLTFQQIQKYERGINRISVSRLLNICNALNAPVNYFLESIESFSEGSKCAETNVAGFSDNKQEGLLYDEDPLSKKDVIALIRAYSKINSPALKKQLLEMAKAMSANGKK